MTDVEPARPPVQKLDEALPHNDRIVLVRRFPHMPLAHDAAEEEDAADSEIASENVPVRQQRGHRPGGVPRRVKNHSAGHAVRCQIKIVLDNKVRLARLGVLTRKAGQIEQASAQAGRRPRAPVPPPQPLRIKSMNGHRCSCGALQRGRAADMIDMAMGDQDERYIARREPFASERRQDLRGTSGDSSVH